MTDTAAPAAEQRQHQGRRRAAGIYGAIVTAAILAAAGGHLPTSVLVVSILVTLVVYWLAEEYAEVLGEQAAAGRLPATSVALALGVVMILLKDLVLVHLH